jgi:hypothetical protein
MNLKVLAMAIAYSSGCGTLAPDIQTKVDSAVAALSPNARWHLGQMTHRGPPMKVPGVPFARCFLKSAWQTCRGWIASSVSGARPQAPKP